MTTTRSKRLAEQLGMPHGTANHRLRKNILFHLLLKHGENICVRCEQTIETVDDLSIEHIKPWEAISVELFWDLNNIAFSHIGCNVPHRYNGGNGDYFRANPFNQKTKNAPEGQAWCSGHKDYVAVENFHSNTRNFNRVASYCKDCRAERKD